MESDISGKALTYVALEAAKRGPIRIGAAEDGIPTDGASAPHAPVSVPNDIPSLQMRR